jgi:hypothetical protein
LIGASFTLVAEEDCPVKPGNDEKRESKGRDDAEAGCRGLTAGVAQIVFV